ncbi:MAG: hypothetical protein ACTSWY_07715 [Promethearchaeota archaeon]
MLLQEETAIEAFLNWFPRSAGWMLFFGGILALTWLGYERKRKKGFLHIEREDWQITEVSKFLRALSYIGLVLGVLMIWAAVIGMINDIPPSFKFRDNSADHYDLFTSVACIVVGLVCFMKPINDLPWAGIIGVFTGIISGMLLAVNMPESMYTIFQPDIVKWSSVIVGILVASLTGMLLKFYIGSVQTISRVLSWPPIALVLSAFCFLQASFLLIWGFSMGAYPLYLS